MSHIYILRCSTPDCDYVYTTPHDEILGQPTYDWWSDRFRLCPRCFGDFVSKQMPSVVAAGQTLAKVTYQAVPTDIQARAEEFHAANPWVFEALEQLTADLVAQGVRRVGIRMLWETVRWQYARSTTDKTSGFKVNDHYHSRYVRFLIDKHPEWADLFEQRVLRA